jgi:hypothetical protein
MKKQALGCVVKCSGSRDNDSEHDEEEDENEKCNRGNASLYPLFFCIVSSVLYLRMASFLSTYYFKVLTKD